MLLGSLIYWDNGKEYRFRIEAVDTSSYCYMRLITNSYDAVSFIEDGSGVAKMSRRLNINISSVKIETTNYIDEKGKKKPRPLNMELPLRLGAVFRYAKSHCYTRYADGYTGLRLATGEYEPEQFVKYNIPLDDGSGMLGTVTLDRGDVYAMHIETPHLRLDLEDDGLDTEVPFYDIKPAISKGFKFDTEHLGFYVAPPVKVQPMDSIHGVYCSVEEIIKANPDKELSWLLQREYYIVDDDMLDEVCKKFMEFDGYIAFDTETTGLNINFMSRIGKADTMTGLILCCKEGESYYFPCQHTQFPNLCGGDHWYFMQRYMKPILENKKLIAHNMAFDWKVTYIYDINANIVHDTMAILHLTLGAERENFRVGLKDNAKLFLGRDSLELGDLVVDDSWGESDITFRDLPYDAVRLYAPTDGDNTLALFNKLMEIDILQKYNAKRVYEIEVMFSFAVAYQEFYGHKVATDKIPKLSEDIYNGIEYHQKKMEEIVGYSFNPNSSKELLRIMYQELGIPPQYNRKTGSLSTDKTALKKLGEITDINGNVKYPFVDHLQKFRTFDGIRKNFLKNLPTLATEDGFIFTGVQQYGTTTGRVSVKNPNYQSYNDEVKKNIEPRKGFYMSDSDYSSVEARILGSMAPQPELIEAFVDPELDYHSYQAARMYNIPYEAVTPKLRKSAKGINFGLPYGMGNESLGVAIFGEASEENTIEAGRLRKKFFVGQENIERAFEKWRDKGVRDGYTETYFGRRRYYHKNKFSESSIRRQAGNQVIQGTAADIYKLAVGRLFLRICKEGWLGKVLISAFVHDEILCEVHKSINPMIWLRVLRESFEVEIDGFCPLYVGFGFGDCWYEAKKVEIPTKLQWKLVDAYGETGYPDWDGDTRKFCDKIPIMIRDFEIDAVKESITAEENQGKVIKPMINTYIHDSVKDDAKYYSSCVSELKSELGVDKLGSEHEDLLLSKLVEFNIHHVFKTDDGEIMEVAPSNGDIQEVITIFCSSHEVVRENVNILSTAPVEIKVGGDDNDEYSDEDYEDDLESQLEDAKFLTIENMGMYVDTLNREVTFKLMPQNFMTMLQGYTNLDGDGYTVSFRNCESGDTMRTRACISSDKLSSAQSLYLQYFKIVQSMS